MVTAVTSSVRASFLSCCAKERYLGRNTYVPKGKGQQKEILRIVETGILLASDGEEAKDGLWENGVYLSSDGFIYHIYAQPWRGGIRAHVSGKRTVGEYLRWVDGLFRPGQVPSEFSGVHYRAARKLRELI